MKRSRIWWYADWRTFKFSVSITINRKGDWADRAHGEIAIAFWQVCFAIEDKSWRTKT